MALYCDSLIVRVGGICVGYDPPMQVVLFFILVHEIHFDDHSNKGYYTYLGT